MKENLAGKTWNQLNVNKFSFTAGYSALRGLHHYNDLLNTTHLGFCLCLLSLSYTTLSHHVNVFGLCLTKLR